MPLASDTRTIHSLTEQFTGCLVLARDLCDIVQQELVHDDTELPREQLRLSCRTALKRIGQLEQDCRGVLFQPCLQPAGIRLLSKTITLCTLLRGVVDHIVAIMDAPRHSSHKKPSLYYFSFAVLFDRVKTMYRQAVHSAQADRRNLVPALRLDTDGEIDGDMSRIDELFNDDIVQFTERYPVLLRLLFIGRELERLADTAAEIVEFPEEGKIRSSRTALSSAAETSPVNRA